jgi:hypothetical protein
VYIDRCAHRDGAGISSHSKVSDLNGFDWYNLQIEECGVKGRSTAGGIDLRTRNQLRKWAFHGGLWEGNFGKAEASFFGPGTIVLTGLYTESSERVTSAIEFDDIHVTIVGGYFASDDNFPGPGLLFRDGLALILNPNFRKQSDGSYSFGGGTIAS